MASIRKKGEEREQRPERSPEDVETAAAPSSSPPPPPAPEAEDPRLKKAVEALEYVADRYEKEEAGGDLGWFGLTLFELVRGAVVSLRHYLETEAGPVTQTSPETVDRDFVSWDAPALELQYAVEWDWEKNSPISGRITSEDVKTDAGAAEKVAEVFLQHRNLFVFQHLTKWAAYRKRWTGRTEHLRNPETGEDSGLSIREEVFEPFLPVDKQAALDALPPDEREARLRTIFRPASFGGVELTAEEVEALEKDLPPETTKEEREELKAALREAGTWPSELEELLSPFLRFEGKADGRPFAGSFAVSFHPLVVDEAKKRAYYPVHVALVFFPDPKTGEEPDPKTWPAEGRREFWDGVLAPMDALLSKGSTFGKEKPEGKEGTSSTSETGTLTPTLPTPAPPVSTLPPPVVAPPHRYLLDGPSRRSAVADALVTNAVDLGLPRRWDRVRQWEDLVSEEVKRLREDYGEDAFRDLRAKGDPDSRGPLLVRRFDPKTGTETVELTREAEENLQAQAGPRAYRRVFKDSDHVHREYLVKRFRAGTGYLEVRLAWYGQAWPLVEGGREKARKDLNTLRDELAQPGLFDSLDAKGREAVNNRLRQLGAIRDGRKVMDRVLAEFGRAGVNPLRMEAWDFYSLLQCENDPHRLDRVRGCLRALQEVRFFFKAARIQGRSGEAFGPFLAVVKYEPRGAGGHGDGTFTLEISPDFVGSLKVFRSPYHEIKNPHRLLLDWGKTLTKDERKELKDGGGYRQSFSSLAPHFDAAKGLTDTQSNLHRWIQSQITRRKDGAAGNRKAVRVKDTAPDADEPRLYAKDFCPLLPDGKNFHGALGRFSWNAERGRTLWGTRRLSTSSGGPHYGGLLEAMGYGPLPPGRATRPRAEVNRKAVADLRNVVEGAFGGVVAPFHKGRWITLAEAEALSPEDLGRKVSWFLFLPDDWRERIPKEIEAHHEARHAEGKTPYLVKVTKDPKAAAASGTPPPGPLGFADLRFRLLAARKKRGLGLVEVGRLFGVSHTAVANWEKGTEPGEDGKVRGKPIPADVAPLLARWIETGTAPTPEELAALKGRKAARSGKRS